MRINAYLKRAIKYILYDFKQDKVYVNVSNIVPSKLLMDKVVLITGGSDGIGLSIAKKFVEQGAKVIISGRNIEKLLKACDKYDISDYFINDVQNINKHDEMLDFVFAKYGKIDILINNAGISLHEKDFFDVTEEEFDNQFNTNFKGAYFLSQNYIRRIINKKNIDASIIFITSERGNQCDYLPYGLTKVAINNLIEGLSCRFIRNNIRVNGIAPGVTASSMTKIRETDDLFAENYISGRKYSANEVSEIALFLSSNFSKCLSGEIIHCNNGNHLNPWFKHSIK
ncbi:MAG: SDR family NAD(P)-dependent oxidoreductase [Bacilli bacterium]|nr:SDR family NAD(P)-dependent oxidoreductase [Bacilli bacterium]